MSEELIKTLEKLKKLLNEEIDKNATEIKDKIKEHLEKGLHRPAKLSIEKDKEGRAKICLEGAIMSQLIALASLEKTILTKYDLPIEIWKMVKESVGNAEAEDNE